MSRRTDVLAGIALVALTLSVPAALAAWLLAGPETAAVALAVEEGAPASPDAPGMPVATGAANSAGPGEPVVLALAGDAPAAPLSAIGILYTRGLASVDWNGVEIPVENGTYAYVGGETVTVGPDAMGVLRLADGSSVFLCPGSRARLEIDADGTFALSVLSGTSRFAFQPGRPFEVDAGGVLIGAQQGPSTDLLIGEVEVPEEGGCVLCGLGGTLTVAGAPPAPAGRIVRVAADGGASVGDIPAAFAAILDAGQLQGGAGDLPFLCRCREIDRYAEGQGEPQPGAVVPPEGVAVPSAPPVEPPGLPALALAEPGPPDPFDPNLLPPPAAGPGTTTVTVPPPLIPTGGSGGGGSASPS